MAITLYDLSGDPSGGPGGGVHRFSPFGWRARMALAHKGLEQDAAVELVRFSDKHKLEFSGQSQVPVLVDGETVVPDSWAIAQYLETAYPDGPSLFGDAAGEAYCRFAAAWTDSQMHPLVARCVVADILNVIDPEDHGYFRESREKRFGVSLEELVANRDETKAQMKMTLYPVRKVVEERAFLGGKTPSFADYAVFGAFMWARCVSDFKLLETDDPVHAWRERMLDLHGGVARNAPGFPV